MTVPRLCLIHIVHNILPSWHTLPLGRMLKSSVTYDNFILPIVVVRIRIHTQWMLLAISIFRIDYSVATPVLELALSKG